MLKFYRPNFMSGVVVVKELVQKEGEPDKVNIWKFHTKDNGKSFNFENEEYLLNKYPVLFTLVI